MAIIGWSIWSTIILVGIVLFFVLAIINKFFNMIFPYNRWTGFVGGLLPYFLISWLFNVKAGLFFGLILGLAGGVIGGIFYGGTESE